MQIQGSSEMRDLSPEHQALLDTVIKAQQNINNLFSQMRAEGTSPSGVRPLNEEELAELHDSREWKDGETARQAYMSITGEDSSKLQSRVDQVLGKR